MPSRYYFDLVKGNLRIPDRTGVDATLEMVMSPEANRIVRDIWPGTADLREWNGWSVEIIDTEGRVVRVMALA
jgi:hypothetical protein